MRRLVTFHLPLLLISTLCLTLHSSELSPTPHDPFQSAFARSMAIETGKDPLVGLKLIKFIEAYEADSQFNPEVVRSDVDKDLLTYSALSKRVQPGYKPSDDAGFVKDLTTAIGEDTFKVGEIGLAASIPPLAPAVIAIKNSKTAELLKKKGLSIGFDTAYNWANSNQVPEAYKKITGQEKMIADVTEFAAQKAEVYYQNDEHFRSAYNEYFHDLQTRISPHMTPEQLRLHQPSLQGEFLIEQNSGIKNAVDDIKSDLADQSLDEDQKSKRIIDRIKQLNDELISYRVERKAQENTETKKQALLEQAEDMKQQAQVVRNAASSIDIASRTFIKDPNILKSIRLMLLVSELSAASMDYEAAKSESDAKQTGSNLASADFFFSLLRISFQIIGTFQEGKSESEYLSEALQALSKQIAELTSLVIEKFGEVDYKLSLALRELNQLSELVRIQSRLTTEQLRGIEARLETLAFANYASQQKFYQKNKALIDEKTRLAVSYSHELSNPISRQNYLEESLIALRNLIINFSTEIQRTSHVQYGEATSEKLREIQSNVPGNLGFLLASEISQRNSIGSDSIVGMSLDTWSAGTELLITAIEKSLTIIDDNPSLKKLSQSAVESSLEQGLKFQHSWNLLKQENPKLLSTIISNYELKLNSYLAELGANKEVFSKLRSSELDFTQPYESILQSAEKFSQPEWSEVTSHWANFAQPGPFSVKFKKIPDEVWKQVSPEFKLAIRLGLIDDLKANVFPLALQYSVLPGRTKNDYLEKGIIDLDGNPIDLNQIHDNNFSAYRLFWTLSAKYGKGPKAGQPVTFHISYGDPTVFFAMVKAFLLPGNPKAQFGLGTMIPFSLYTSPKINVRSKLEDENGAFQKNIFNDTRYLPLDANNRGIESLIAGFIGLKSSLDSALISSSTKFFSSHFYAADEAPLNSERERELPHLTHFFETHTTQAIYTTMHPFMKLLAHAKVTDREHYKTDLIQKLKEKLSLEKADFLDRSALAFSDAETGQKSEIILSMEYQRALLQLALQILYQDMNDEQVKSVFALLYGPQRLPGAKDIQTDLLRGQSYDEIREQASKTLKHAYKVSASIEAQCGKVTHSDMMGRLKQLIALRDRLLKNGQSH